MDYYFFHLAKEILQKTAEEVLTSIDYSKLGQEHSKEIEPFIIKHINMTN